MIDQIVKLVDDTVAPDDWKDNGGGVGEIHDLAGRLIIRQSFENHRQIIWLMEQLREARSRTSGPSQ